MKKIVLFCAILMSTGLLYARECKNCGFDGERFYRCKECGTYFCNRCEEGRGTQNLEETIMKRLLWGGLAKQESEIACPECGTKDIRIFNDVSSHMKYGRIKEL